MRTVKLGMVAVVLLLAVMLAVPASARSRSGYDDSDYALGPFSSNYKARAERQNRLADIVQAADQARADRRMERASLGGYTLDELDDVISGRGRGYDDEGYGREGRYGRSDRNYGRNYGRNRSGLDINVSTRIGRTRLNVGYNKSTVSRSPSRRPVIVKKEVTVVRKQADSSCMMLVTDCGDGRIEEISPIVVTNPEKVLVNGTRIVFNGTRAVDGETITFCAEYSVIRVSGESVFVKVINDEQGSPCQGDTFSIN